MGAGLREAVRDGRHATVSSMGHRPRCALLGTLLAACIGPFGSWRPRISHVSRVRSKDVPSSPPRPGSCLFPFSSLCSVWRLGSLSKLV